MRAIRILLIVILSLFLVLLIAGKPIFRYLEGIIQSRLLEYINTSPDRLYDYHVGRIDISILGGNSTITNVSILPRQEAIDSLNSAQTALLIWAEIDSIALRGLGLYNLFVKDAIHIQHILIGEVDFKYTINSSYKRPDTLVSKPFVLKDVFSEKLNKAYVKHVELRNISLVTDDVITPEDFLTKFDSATVSIREIYTDEDVMLGSQPFTYESLEMSAKNFTSVKVKGYTAHVDDFKMNTAKKEIYLKGASFGPTAFSYHNTAKQFTRSISDISAEELKLSGINFDSWQTVGWVEIQHVDIIRPRIQVSMDHRWAKPMHERELVQSQVRSIPFPLRIDTVSARGGEVYYREIFNDGKPPLILTFAKMEADIFNVTNQPELIKKDPILRLTAKAEFLNDGSLIVKSDFRLNDTLNPFRLTLSLKTMALATLNPILEGQAHARLNGQLNILALDIQADRKGAYGDFVFDFSGLKVTLFKEKHTKHGLKEKKHWLLNTIVNPILRTNNHVDEANFKGGNVAYVRPPDVSFFGMVWQCVKEGMVLTLVPGKHDEKDKHSTGKSKKKRRKR